MTSEWHDFSRGLLHTRSRSQPETDSRVPTRRQSTPVRWHPEYGASLFHSNAASPNKTLDTILEDASTSLRRQTPTYFDSPSRLPPSLQLFPGQGDSRRHSDGQVNATPLHNVNFSLKRYSHGDMGHVNSNTPGGRGFLTGTHSPSKHDKVPSRIANFEHQTDATGEIEQSKNSVHRNASVGSLSHNSLPTKENRTRRKSDQNALYAPKRVSVSSLPNTESRRQSTTSSRHSRHSQHSRRSAASRRSRSAHSMTSGSSRTGRPASAKGEEPVVVTSIEIPSELLGNNVSQLRKLLGPVVVVMVIMALMITLATAVYFAVVLKETQDSQIEFLEATLQFTIANREENRDFSRLTPMEREELKTAYCKQVDELYIGSSLQSHYRGCELNVLTNDRITFRLFFLEPSGSAKEADDIVRVLALNARHVGKQGSSLRRISDVTVSIDPASTTVDLTLTKKPQDFYGANSQTLDDEVVSQGQGNEFRSTTRLATSIITILAQTTKAVSTTNLINPPSVHDTVLSRDICSSIRTSELVAHPSDCGHFVQCEFGTPIARPCNGGLVFDPIHSACVKPRPDLPCTEIQPCNNVNGGHFAHPTNCHLFIVCDQNKSVMRSCPNSLVWDTHSLNCVPRKRGTDCQPQ